MVFFGKETRRQCKRNLKNKMKMINKYNESDGRCALGFVPLDVPQISIEDAYKIVKRENPTLDLYYKTLDFFCNEIMKKCIPKPNPKFVIEFLKRAMWRHTYDESVQVIMTDPIPLKCTQTED